MTEEDEITGAGDEEEDEEGEEEEYEVQKIVRYGFLSAITNFFILAKNLRECKILIK